MKEIAKLLLEIKAVEINNRDRFKWASGIMSPIYTDNRLINSFPAQRKIIEKAFAEKVIQEFPGVEIVMGTATAGISHAAYISDVLNLPMGYVRSGKKDHGRQNQIEGMSVKNKKVVVIEDLLSTGRSSLEVVEALEAAGAEVLGIAAIFSYELKILSNNIKNTKHFTLTNINELLSVAVENNYININDADTVKEFINNL